MAFVNELEDVNSIMMTAVQSLLEKYEVDPKQIGRLEVGTETLIDKSKSVKSTICQLLTDHGNHDVEGIDSVNACYGGTAALLNSLAWVESSAYDGRYALVVCGDIAVYEPGPARPTGGCAAVAMLIGPDAPLVVEPALRASHFENAYDFYKPNLNSEYPVVFGHESNVCYLRALDNCYQRFADKFEAQRKRPFSIGAEADHVIFHSPYNKLVKKSGARMLLNDYQRDSTLAVFDETGDDVEGSVRVADGKALEDTYYDRDVEKAFVNMAKPMYESKVAPSTLLPRELGNSYTASAYTGLLSLIDSWHANDETMRPDPDEHHGKNVLMFSYGSGLASSLFSLTVVGDTSEIAEKADLKNRLDQRVFKTPEEFTETLLKREHRYNQKGYSPSGNPEDDLFPGTYYLQENDEFGRRKYARTPLDPATVAVRQISANKKKILPKINYAKAVRAFSTVARRVLLRR
jgi:hydroxymethylglutaryl-CoA synthase